MVSWTGVLASGTALLLSVLLTLVLTILFQEPIHWLLARLLGGISPRRHRSVKGIWRTTYTYPSTRNNRIEAKTEVHYVELRQFGEFVWGRNLFATEHWYRVRAKLDKEIYLTGLWENTLEGNIYHGAFQFVLAADGRSMKGKWIGFSKRQNINHGTWEWTLITSDTGRGVRNKIVKQAMAELSQTS